MDDAIIDKRVSEILGKYKLQEAIDSIAKKNEDIDKRVDSIDKNINEKFIETGERLDAISTTQNDFAKKQEEACVGVDCVKKDLRKIDELKGEVGNMRGDISKLSETVGSEYYKCSGPKGCNEDIKVGSSFCPNCGAKISEWEGHPEWVPYWKRQR